MWPFPRSSPWRSPRSQSMYLLRLGRFFTESNNSKAPVLQDEPSDNLIRTIAWVQKIRKHKKLSFLDVNDGSSPNNLQVVFPSSKFPSGVIVGSAIGITGRLVTGREQRSTLKQPDSNADNAASLNFASELVADSIEPLSSYLENVTDLSLLGAMSNSRPIRGLLRSERGLFWRHRLPEMAAMLRLRAECKSIVHGLMRRNGYLEIDTPILTTTDCEGAGETFVARPSSSQSSLHKPGDPPSTPLHLTVSAQLHLEAAALGMSKVFTLSPTFRAESSHSRFHLAEFLMLECESVYLNTLDALCAEIESVVRSMASDCLQGLTENPDHQIDFQSVLSYLSDDTSKSTLTLSSHLDKVNDTLSQDFVRLRFHEAVSFLQSQGLRTSDDAFVGGLTKNEEQAVCTWAGDRIVLLTDFPSALKPFYCAYSESSTSGSPVAAVDLLVPGIGELVGGSVRENDANVLQEKMKWRGIDPQNSLLSWYVNLRSHGSAPHGGFGFGFDRFLLWILGVYNIRDTVPFPRELNKIFL